MRYFISWYSKTITKKGIISEGPHSDIVDLDYHLDTKENLRKFEKTLTARNMCNNDKNFSTVSNIVRIFGWGA